MTEQEWFETYSFFQMLQGIHDRLSERKLRLYACGCCRRVWHHFDDVAFQRAVELSEKFADGQTTLEELEAVAIGSEDKCDQIPRPPGAIAHATHREKASFFPTQCACMAALCCAYHPLMKTPVASGHVMDEYWRVVATSVAGDVYLAAGWEATRRYYAQQPVGMSDAQERREEDAARERAEDHESQQLRSLLRCVAGNPFKPTVLSPHWLTPAVTQLAASIYELRAFDRMPLLGDALEEAGCSDEAVLKHCRSGGEHVRGCHVVDLILGK